MEEGNIFSLFTLAGRAGVPLPRSGGGTPSQVWVGGYPISGLGGGYPIPGLDGGYPPPPGLNGVPPTQAWMVGVPRVSPTRTGWGTPTQVWMVGVPSTPPPPGLNGVPPTQVWMVGVPWVPPPGLDEVPPTQGIPHQDWMRYPPHHQDWMGYPPTQVWMVGGTPHQDWMRYPPTQGTPTRNGWGTPHPGLDGGGTPAPPPIRQSSIASTCYATGGVPLAFLRVFIQPANVSSPTYLVLRERDHCGKFWRNRKKDQNP